MPQLSVEQTLLIARQHHQAGQYPQAETLYRQILQQHPNHPEALHLLGILAFQGGRHDIAVGLIGQAIALSPHNPEAYRNLGVALEAKGQRPEAIVAYRKAIALKPDYAETYSNLGMALKAEGQLDEAIAAYRQALALKPLNPTIYLNLGMALRARGQFDEALAVYRQAIVIAPTLAEAHNNLGVVLTDQGQLDAARAAYRQAIALAPQLAEAHNNLAMALMDNGQLDEAIASYYRAIALKSNFPDAYSNLGAALKDQGQLDEALAMIRQAMALDPNNAAIHGNLLYTMQFHPAYDARAMANVHRLWNHQHAEPLRQFVRPHLNDRGPGRRLKVGYVSPDLRRHPVGRYLLPLLAHHDKNQVEVFAYTQVPVPDDVTRQLRSHTGHWRDLAGCSDEQTAQLIRDDKIDILVDLTMHMARNRLLVFARKPAPVQVTYLAYCSTTGLEAIDYRLSDPYMDPPEMDESVYSERTMRLPDCYWCYQPIIAAPEFGPLPALEQGHITFGCLNNFCKVSEPTLAAWAKILQAVPNSQLLIHAPEGGSRQRVQERLKGDGIAPRRVQFAGFVPIESYFDLYHRIDMALDTFPCGGGTTTCDALWMGVPVVSLLGQTAVGRGGLSILSNIGLPELVARSEDEYVRIAAELAHDLPRLSHLRSTLRPRMERSPLMNAPRFARNVEFAYRQMWRQWCEQS